MKSQNSAGMADNPIDLRCEYVTEPVGIDVKKPRFSWVLQSEKRSAEQTAYRLVVATSPEALEPDQADCWDSGKAASNETAQIEYAGKPLESNTTYFWKVCVWDGPGKQSAWSHYATFSTGLLSPDDWKAMWITGEGTARRDFTVEKPVACAYAYVCGLGYYELRLNGRKVGDYVLDPGWTDYDKTVLYTAFNITPLLCAGENVAGLLLGNGRYNPPDELVARSPIELNKYGTRPVGIVQINICYTDGTSDIVVSDGSWKVTEGPIVMNDIWDGETYDARLEKCGWDLPGYDASDWQNASVVEGPKGKLRSHATFPHIKVNKTIQPRSVTNPRPGVYVFDFGQNFAGWVKLKNVNGQRGTEVKLRFAELLDAEGMLNTVPNREAKATDTYILHGAGGESWEPRFTYHGFRYVEVTGFPGTPDIENIEGKVVHSAVEPTGSFSCSNQLINQIHSLVLWSQKSNLMSVPTDCPQRDERMGWMGDAQLTSEEAVHNFSMAGFYSKYVNDIADAQREDGQVSDVIPAYWSLYPADPAWGTATIVLPWTMYLYYGDERILKDRYEVMKKYVEYLKSQAKDGLVSYGKFGDWCPPMEVVSSKTPIHFTAAWYYFHDVLTLSKIAKKIGRDEDAAAYEELAETIKKKFNERYLLEDRYSGEDMETVMQRMELLMPGDVSDDQREKRIRSHIRLLSPISQTANTLPLYLDMVPEEKRQAIIDNLIENIANTRSGHLNMGIVGTRYIFHVLTELGYADLAYKVVTRDTYPSWGYMIKEGATTLWERWEDLVEGGMNSHNHIMFGTMDSWFYKTLAGIVHDPDAPAYRHFCIEPHPVGDLTHASASLNTVRGQIVSEWRKGPGRKDAGQNRGAFALEVRVPAGSRATVSLPVGELSGEPAEELTPDTMTVKESETVVWENARFKEGVDGITEGRAENGRVLFEVGSGRYRFTVEV